MGDQDLQQSLGELLEIKGKYMKDSSSRNVLWKNTWLGGWKSKSRRRSPTRNIRRRRVRRAGAGDRSSASSRRATTMVIERKVRTLKKLIPNGESSVGLDGLFIETAEYISNLQRRVRIMQALVDAFSTSH